MNSVAIRSLRDLLYMMHHEDCFIPTSRVVKYVLASSPEQLTLFLPHFDGGNLRAVHLGAVHDGYAEIPTYAQGARIVEIEVAKRKAAAERRARKHKTPEIDDPFWMVWNPKPGTKEPALPAPAAWDIGLSPDRNRSWWRLSL